MADIIFRGLQLDFVDAIDNIVKEDEPKGEVIDTKMCLYPGTAETYVDCCTDSSLKVCTYLSVMFWSCFVGYAALFIYIVNKNKWIKQHGLYLNVFFFQMFVLICKNTLSINICYE